jgi:alpha-beta hydrolase superfamily lysophospholipase
MIYLIFLPVLLILGFIVAIHLSFRAPRLSNDVLPIDYGLDAQTHEFIGQQSTQLSVWWVDSAQPSHTTVVILHGWGANKSYMLPLAKPFHQAGYNLLLIDAHSHGDSEKRGVSTMPKFAEDLVSAVHWLNQNKPKACQKTIIVGHSVGAAAVLLAAANGLKANIFISIASFVHPKLIMQRTLKKLKPVPGLIPLISNYVQWAIGYKFDAIAPITSIKKISQPTLLVHGTEDSVIPLSDFHLLCNATQKESIKCLEIPGADHDSIDKIEAHFSELHDFIKST